MSDRTFWLCKDEGGTLTFSGSIPFGTGSWGYQVGWKIPALGPARYSAWNVHSRTFKARGGMDLPLDLAHSRYGGI